MALQAGVVKTLIGMLESDDHRLVRAATLLVFCFAYHGPNPAASIDTVPTLAQMYVRCCLFCIHPDDHISFFFLTLPAGCACRPQVRSSVAAVRAVADRDMQEVLIEGGVIIPLTKLMQDSPDDVYETAVRALIAIIRSSAVGAAKREILTAQMTAAKAAGSRPTSAAEYRRRLAATASSTGTAATGSRRGNAPLGSPHAGHRPGTVPATGPLASPRARQAAAGAAQQAPPGTAPSPNRRPVMSDERASQRMGPGLEGGFYAAARANQVRRGRSRLAAFVSLRVCSLAGALEVYTSCSSARTQGD